MSLLSPCAVAARTTRSISAVRGGMRPRVAATLAAAKVFLVAALLSPLATRAFLVPHGRRFDAPPSRQIGPLSPERQWHVATKTRTADSRSRLGFFGNDWFGGDGPEPSSPPKPAETTTAANVDDEPDLVERIFGVFFGAKEEAPMGLKRFGRERFPEQYPATTTEWADPVATDDKEVAALRPLLKNTNLESRPLQLAYSANRDGWTPQAFHAKVDKKGPSLVVLTTADGQVAGGYNPKGWVSYGEARGSIAAFLFVKSTSGSGWTKLCKVGGPSLAQLDYPESGPSFGADSLVIPLSGSNPKQARSKLGSYYERFPDGTNSLFGPNRASVALRDLKVYQGVYESGEFIPFTDAEPFALY